MDRTPKIGKDVIESLTLGMYEDSRFIYREYIQNSADQIDKAVRDGIMTKSEEEIHINIDVDSKRVEVYDNATGIRQDKVLPILQNIAQSTKKRGVDKGFRGIGRLGGLGYCTRLIFETSAKGEAVKSTMVWDAKLLKEIINNRDDKEDAADVIAKVTKITTLKESEDEHYFKVILENVSNKNLLDVTSIRDYLSMVAPVDYNKSRFIYKSKIYDYTERINSEIDNYKIFINGEIVEKSYTSNIYRVGKNGRKEPFDEVLDVEFVSETASDGQMLFWGWFSISSSKAQMSNINKARGIRLRKANIQLGAEDTISRFFPKEENRWNFYYFGEIHAVHPDLIPNARRDYFSENSICDEFESKLKEHLLKLYKLTYAASDLNTSNKKIQEAKNAEAIILEKQSTGFKDKEEQDKLYKELKEKQLKAQECQAKIEKTREKAQREGLPIEKIYERNTSNKDTEMLDLDSCANTKPKYITDAPQYSSMSKDKRKLLGRVYSIIGNILPKETYELVVRKIEEELTK